MEAAEAFRFSAGISSTSAALWQNDGALWSWCSASSLFLLGLEALGKFPGYSWYSAHLVCLDPEAVLGSNRQPPQEGCRAVVGEHRPGSRTA